MLDKLLLISGNDIPFPEAQLIIHTPTLKEIAFLGESTFFTGFHFLCVSKNMLEEKDKVDLETIKNFDILIAILEEPNAVMQENSNCAKMVLALLFPNYIITINNKEIHLKSEEDETVDHVINRENFDNFQSIIKQMFNVGDEEQNQELNPAGEMSKRIAEKLNKRRQKLSELKDDSSDSIIERFVSVLSVALKLDINTLLNYTLYQFFDQIKRYELKNEHDFFIQAKLAGATDLKEPED